MYQMFIGLNENLGAQIEKVKGYSKCSAAGSTLTVVNEVLEDLLAARLHGVVQQRAASRILQQDVLRLLVELHQLEHKGQSLMTQQRQEGDQKLQTHPVQVLRPDAVDQFCI